MPRPSSGNPQWEAVAVKLPPALFAQVRRYADLYGTSVSELLRQGLELRLHPQEVRSVSDGQPTLPPDTVAMLRQLALTLTTAAAEVGTICQEQPDNKYNRYTSTREEAYNRYTSTRESEYNRYTSTREEAYGDHTVAEEEAYNSNTFMVTPTDSSLETFPKSYDSRQPDHEQVSPTPRPLDAAEDLEDMPLGVSVAIAPQSAKPPVSPHVSPQGDKARVLAQLHAWKAAGVSLQTMADRLNTSEVPTFSGKGTWKKGTIGNLLTQRQAAPVA